MPISFTTSADSFDPTASGFSILHPGTMAQLARQVRSLRQHGAHSPRIALILRPVMATQGGGVLQRLGLTPRRALVAPQSDAVDLVGTLDQVAEAVLACYDIGVDHLILRGGDPLETALIALVRRRLARRDAVLSVLAGSATHNGPDGTGRRAGHFTAHDKRHDRQSAAGRFMMAGGCKAAGVRPAGYAS